MAQTRQNVAHTPMGGAFQAGTIPASGQTQTLSLSTSSAATGALTGGLYRLVTDTDCFLAAGASPTATTSDMPLAADKEEYFNVVDGEKIAGILSTGTGTLTLTRMG